MTSLNRTNSYSRLLTSTPPTLKRTVEARQSAIQASLYTAKEQKTRAQERMIRKENYDFAMDPGAGIQPSLYYKNAEGTSRLRQEHTKGETIDEIKKRKHVFFDTKQQARAFKQEIKQLNNKGSALTPTLFREVMEKHGGSQKKESGKYHADIWFKEDYTGKVHVSRGTVVPLGSDRDKELKASTEQVLRKIKDKIEGQGEDYIHINSDIYV